MNNLRKNITIGLIALGSQLPLSSQAGVSSNIFTELPAVDWAAFNGKDLTEYTHISRSTRTSRNLRVGGNPRCIDALASKFPSYVEAVVNYKQNNDSGILDKWTDCSGQGLVRKDVLARIQSEAEQRRLEREAQRPQCFVATSAYENIDHPTVDRLRDYRDEVLSESEFGREFINFYYGGFGEKAAEVLDSVPQFKPYVRSTLDFFVENFVEPTLEKSN